PGYDNAAGNLRLYMAQLRRKLEPDPARPRWLITEPGMGYRYQPPEQEAIDRLPSVRYCTPPVSSELTKSDLRSQTCETISCWCWWSSRRLHSTSPTVSTTRVTRWRRRSRS